MATKISLGDRRGIQVWGPLEAWLTNCHYVRLRFPGRFDVLQDSENCVVLERPGLSLRLWSDGRRAYIGVDGSSYLFEPFLNLSWLRRMIGLR